MTMIFKLKFPLPNYFRDYKKLVYYNLLHNYTYIKTADKSSQKIYYLIIKNLD